MLEKRRVRKERADNVNDRQGRKRGTAGQDT